MICKILGVRIGSFDGNFVNEGDLNFTTIVSCDVPISLTSMTLGRSTNFGRVLFGRFATVISIFVLEIVLLGGGRGARLTELGIGEGSRHTRF